MSDTTDILLDGFNEAVTKLKEAKSDLANEKAAHQGALLRERMLAQRLADMEDWLHSVIDEVDDYDDHDGKTGHISYATVALTRQKFPKAVRA